LALYPAHTFDQELLVESGGREATIVVEPSDTHGWRVEVDGAPRNVDARQLRPGTWSLLIDGHSYLVDLDPRKNGIAASVEGSGGLGDAVITVEDAKTRRLRQNLATGPTVRGEDVRAPIAGKVVKILCAVGDEVPAGHAVAVIEAMNMEKEICKTAGQSAESGELLLVLV
jgi:biotin carboxyl carrier protein